MPIIFKKNKQGFVLIEMVIYIALFSIIMSGLIVTTYHLSKSTTDLESKIAILEEVSFVSKKITWAITGASDIAVPNANTLNINNSNLSPNTMVIRFDTPNKKIEFKKNNTLGFSPITTVNVVVKSLVFTYIPPASGVPEGVNIDFIINGINVHLVKYLKI